MKAIVVYESLWGNSAAVARADLIVAGAPVLGFRLPTDKILKTIGDSAARERVAPDLTQPSMRSWLDALPKGNGRSAAFETRIRLSPGAPRERSLASWRARDTARSAKSSASS